MGIGTAAAIGLGISAIGAATQIGNSVNSANKAGDAAKNQQDAAAQAQATAAAGQKSLEPAMQQQQALAQQAAASNGFGNQSSVFNQQQQLANQLQQASLGQGPNPALAQLQQTTGQNVAGTAALMAGQRGAGANVGLMARQIGQQGAATQQQAVGQGATLAANQQIAARQQLGQQQAQMGSIAGQQVQQQIGTQDAATQAAIQKQGLAQGLALGNQTNANNASTLGAETAAGLGNTVGKVAGGIGTALGAAAQQPQTPKIDVAAPGSGSGSPNLGVIPQAPAGGNIFGVGKANGGLIEHLASGGQVGPKSYITHHIMGAATPLKLAMGGKVPAMVSPGEIYLSPEQANKAASGSKEALAHGLKIKGKAKVKGDSEVNDTVPKTLEQGGVVIPRTTVQQGDDAKQKFVAAAKSKGKKK